MKEWRRKFIRVLLILIAVFVIFSIFAVSFFLMNRGSPTPLDVFQKAGPTDWNSTTTTYFVEDASTTAAQRAADGARYRAGNTSKPTKESRAGAAFDPSTIKAGDSVGGFKATDAFYDPDYGFYHADFTGQLTVTGTLAENDMCGPYIEDIATDTAEKLPHAYDWLGHGFTIDDDTLNKPGFGSDLQYGDQVQATMQSYSVGYVAKDCSGTIGVLSSIRLVEPVKRPSPQGGQPNMSALSFTVPDGWVVQSGDAGGAVIQTPDYKTRDSLADFLQGRYGSVLSGRMIQVEYTSDDASGTHSTTNIDSEIYDANHCSNCFSPEVVTVAGVPAFMESTVWETATTTTVHAGHQENSGDGNAFDVSKIHGGELTVSMSPGIGNDGDRAFLMSFLASIKYK